MHIINVRFLNHIPLGQEVIPDNYMERGRNLSGSSCIDLLMYDAMFLKLTFNDGHRQYSQFVPWAQVASVMFDDAPTEKPQA